MSKLSGHLSRSVANTLGLAILFLMLAPTISRAELIDYFSDALPGWSNTTSPTAYSGSGLNVTLYYAVFGRETFDSTFGGGVFPGDDNDGYVYAYQLVNASGSTKAITKFTVGVAPNELPEGITQSVLGGASGTGATVAASVAFASGTTSAVWTYSSPTISAGGKSEILLFTSPYAPDPSLVSCTIAGSGASSDRGSVPIPVPEPSALLSLTVAGLCFVLFCPIRSMFSS